MRPTLTALLAGVGLISLIARRPRSNHDKPHERGIQDKLAAAGEPPRPVLQPTNGNQATGDEKRDERERRFRWWGFWINLASAGATVAAAGFAAFAYKASLIAVDEARKQVAAARQANEISNRALAAAIGASVHAGRLEFRLVAATSAAEDIKINVQLTIGNDGGTTTRGLAYRAACVQAITPPDDPFDVSRLSASRNYTLTLAPKAEAKPIVCSYNLKEWALMTATKASIYVFGQAIYNDTINPVEKHRLKFCTRLYDLAFNGTAFTPGPFALAEECGRHNCNDEECDAAPNDTAAPRDPYAL